MPTAPVPIFNGQYTNIDGIQVEATDTRIVDGYVDEAKFVVKRPGLKAFASLASSDAVYGLHWWDVNGYFVAVSSTTVYKITAAGSVSTIGTGFGDSATQVVFAEGEISGTNTLFIAAGGNLFRTDGTTLTNMESSDDSDIPDDVTHVAVMDGYVIVNSEGNSTFHYSTVNDPLTWSALDFATAEAKEDAITAIHVKNNELVLFGPESIETWYNDGSTPFAPFEGGVVQNGTSAPYSIQVFEDDFFFLDQYRNVVRMKGRQTQTVSGAIARDLQELDTVSDAYAYILRDNGQEFYVITFPTATRADGSSQTGMTYAYHIQYDRWYEFSFWDTGNSDYGPLRMRSATYNISDGKTYIGSNVTDGDILELDRATFQDDGVPVRTLVQTGWVDHGTHVRKRSNRLSVRMKRGVTNGSGSNVTVSYRNESEGSFSSSFTQEIDDTDTDFLPQWYRMGQYRARQYQFVHSDNTEFIIGDVMEDVEILAS